MIYKELSVDPEYLKDIVDDLDEYIFEQVFELLIPEIAFDELGYFQKDKTPNPFDGSITYRITWYTVHPKDLT